MRKAAENKARLSGKRFLVLPGEDLTCPGEHGTWKWVEPGGEKEVCLAMDGEGFGLRAVGWHLEPGVGCMTLSAISEESYWLRESCC